MNKKLLLIRDRVLIYKDFAINLLYTIDKYYLDRQTLSEDEDIKNHFNFCYDKVCDGFEKEEIYFKNNDELRKYYYGYYYYEYYINENETEFKVFDTFMKDVFNITTPKNKAYLEALLEIYEISDKTINNLKIKEENLAF